ncbi:probable LRR receptor-like serine/threonine-protein kinase At3g47570 [Camellia sinensis]|uniref:probable LRR receptor-like serine/threonine-protein kinase At3g47570 n=1 Tax=Camellia sinensis TaxID=4442 RepID=UPI0010369943|nr:probable LRR receptor-like serine/threonine-protein kinase At3g47570 [Camellia sinensis]
MAPNCGYLSHNNLNGSIPPEIGKLSSISISLNLAYNVLISALPSKVGSLKNLEKLDVSNNRLLGSNPNSLRNCLSVESLHLEELLKATDGFSEDKLIGVGNYGSVYKEILDQVQTIVAVKVLNLQLSGASKSFMSECKALRTIRHRNLLKILSTCSSVDFQGNEFKALVYKFMANRSLEKWLHNDGIENNGQEEESRNLKLIQRLNIAIDVASAIDYLHCHCDSTIIHGDLKSSNVLLDDEMIAHVGDFGLAKIISTI